MAAADLTSARLRELISYCPDSGEIRWRQSVRKDRIGSIAGSPSGKGYRQCAIDRHNYTVHRLVWLYVFGEWPLQQLDHINGVRDDNRICNLRDVAPVINSQNMRRAMPVNSSGLLGVTKNNGNTWSACIKANGKRTYLGNFKSPELAHAVYIEAKRKLHPGSTI